MKAVMNRPLGTKPHQLTAGPVTAPVAPRATSRGSVTALVMVFGIGLVTLYQALRACQRVHCAFVFDRDILDADLAQFQPGLQDALDADPTLKETEMALGRLYLASGRHEQAEAVYRSLLRRSPRDAEVRIGLGRAQGDFHTLAAVQAYAHGAG